jgi:quercetin dioxygenase-like cupin family protein
MAFINLEDIEEREIVPGYHARFVHAENMTLAYWRIEAGAALPSHAHPHEQVTRVSEGEFELTVDGETRILNSGQVALIPGNASHGGKAVSDCRITDVFFPVREDYKRKPKASG